MTKSFYKKKSRLFFTTGKAILTASCSNLGGERIELGEVVTIMKKTLNWDYCFDIRNEKGVEIHNVSCELLELIK